MLGIILVLVIGLGIALYFLAPKSDRRGHYDPRQGKIADAQSSLTFHTDDEARAVEYEHRFSGSRTGMALDRRGYRVRKRRD